MTARDQPHSELGPTSSRLPLIALTMGDVAGIGPEVIARTCAQSGLGEFCRPLVVGHPEILSAAAELAGLDLDVAVVSSPAEVDLRSTCIPCWNPADDDVLQVPHGVHDARAGRAAYDYLVAAARAALAGVVDAVTTAPLNKKSLHLAGREYPGHTEILAEECGTDAFAMMLYLPPGETPAGSHGLGVAHVTLHTPIASVPQLLTKPGIEVKIELLAEFMQSLGCLAPRIGVCALNPHAGESGLFGDEEAALIAPAVASARNKRLDVTGPLPADTLLMRAVQGEFDAVVAMYHDQGHIALKLIGFDRAVNVTLGLPIVRTSPSHGTAFDVAWQGRARSAGMFEAVKTAALLAEGRVSVPRETH